NVLETSRLWREVATRVVRDDFKGIELEHQLVDSCALRLLQRPAEFDDILTDLTAVLGGSIGMLPSASIGLGGPGLYEPVHGSAPDIAGKGVANPLATFGSVALMLRHSLGMEDAAAAVESAVDRVLERGLRTPDLATGRSEESEVGTEEMTAAVIDELSPELRKGTA